MTRRLRALWALTRPGPLGGEMTALLADGASTCAAGRGSSSAEGRPAAGARARSHGRDGAQDVSPMVRRYLAGAMQRVPVEQRWEVCAAHRRARRGRGRPHLPLMFWWAASRWRHVSMARAGGGGKFELPSLLPYTVRRIGRNGRGQARRALAGVSRAGHRPGAAGGAPEGLNHGGDYGAGGRPVVASPRPRSMADTRIPTDGMHSASEARSTGWSTKGSG